MDGEGLAVNPKEVQDKGQFNPRMACTPVPAGEFPA